MIFFLSNILSLCTTIRPKNRVLINLLVLFAHDHSRKLGVTLTLLFILFLDVPIFRLLYSWQILPWYFLRSVSGRTSFTSSSAILIVVLPISFVRYLNWRAALIFCTLYPWLYEIIAWLDRFMKLLRLSQFLSNFMNYDYRNFFSGECIACFSSLSVNNQPNAFFLKYSCYVCVNFVHVKGCITRHSVTWPKVVFSKS